VFPVLISLLFNLLCCLQKHGLGLKGGYAPTEDSLLYFLHLVTLCFIEFS
jgi:hypothetical protein